MSVSGRRRHTTVLARHLKVERGHYWSSVALSDRKIFSEGESIEPGESGQGRVVGGRVRGQAHNARAKPTDTTVFLRLAPNEFRHKVTGIVPLIGS